MLAVFSTAYAGVMGPKKTVLPAEAPSVIPCTQVQGIVTDREDIWDRRPNSLMGRPDQLTKIIFTIQITSVLQGSCPLTGSEIKAVAGSRDMIIKLKGVTPGSKGNFTFAPDGSYELIDCEITQKPAPKTTPAPNTMHKPTAAAIRTVVPEDEEGLLRISGREMLKSSGLQEKAVRIISARYKLVNARFISLTSFSGPVPPSGGYVYWGVTGSKNGKQYVWQAHMGLKEGNSLEDPQRYNKCMSADTLISAPCGPKVISAVKTGDLVMSGSVYVKVLKVSKVKAKNHRVCMVTFDDKTVLKMSPGHPAAEGVTAEQLKKGSVLDGRGIVENILIDYSFDYTYDILPDSADGSYYANGVRVLSTLK